MKQSVDSQRLKDLRQQILITAEELEYSVVSTQREVRSYIDTIQREHSQSYVRTSILEVENQLNSYCKEVRKQKDACEAKARILQTIIESYESFERQLATQSNSILNSDKRGKRNDFIPSFMKILFGTKYDSTKSQIEDIWNEIETRMGKNREQVIETIYEKGIGITSGAALTELQREIEKYRNLPMEIEGNALIIARETMIAAMTYKLEELGATTKEIEKILNGSQKDSMEQYEFLLLQQYLKHWNSGDEYQLYSLNEDGTYVYDWDKYERWIHKDPESLNGRYYEALLDMMDTLIDNGNDSGINHEAFKQMLNHSYRYKIYDGVKIGSVDYKLDDNGLVVVSVGVPFGETKKFVKVYELADSFRTLAIMYGTKSKLMYNEHQGELYDNIVGSESERNLLSSITLSTAMNNVCDYMERIQYVSRTLGYNYKSYENEIFYDDFKDVNLDFYITENANNDSINVGVGHQFRGNKGDWVLSDSYEFDLFPAKPNMMSSLLDVSSVYIGQPKNSMEIAEQAMLQTIESEVSGVLKDIILVGTGGKITKVGLDYGKNVITLAEENSKKIEEQVLNKIEKVVEILHLGGTVSMIDGQYTINNCYVNRNFLENYAKVVIENFGKEYVLFRYDEETEQDKIKQMKSLAKEYEALIIGFFNGQYHVNPGDDKATIEEKQKKEADFWGLVEAIEESKINTSSDADNDDTSFKTRQEILEERSQGENDEAKK